MSGEYYKKTAKETISEFSTSSEKGLSVEEVENRLKKYGPNDLKKEKTKTWFNILIEQFESPIVWVLILAAVISGVAGELIDSIVILAILIINTILGFVQEFKAENVLEKLKELTSMKATVIRNGHMQTIDAKQLVPGDIIVLSQGSIVPADARLIESSKLKIQEATLTGESVPSVKHTDKIFSNKTLADMENMVFSSTIVVSGSGKAVVVATGKNSELGKIAYVVQKTEEKETHMAKQTKILAKWLSIITLVVILAIFATNVFMRQESILEMFLVAIALGVAAIPEGLPAVITLSLSLAVKRMAKNNMLIRKLPSIETLGSVTVICTDKTGTLTQNKMTVRSVWVNDELVGITGEGYKPIGEFTKKPEDLELLLRIGLLNNDSDIDAEKDEAVGDPTESCLITSALKYGLNKEKELKDYRKIAKIPFSSERKMMSTIVEHKGKRYLYVKGAVDVLMPRCKFFQHMGMRRMLTNKIRDDIHEQDRKFARKAMRILGFAYKELDKKEPINKDIEKDLIFVGMQAMIDPPRKNVKQHIKDCNNAGIRVIMITGDDIDTAKSIASEIGISGGAMSGKELEEIPFEKLVERIKDINVFARVDPKHKLDIVAALQKTGEIVAMTGDGVNDSPAIKKAEIGISMGDGTDVSKEASEMILVTDDFRAIPLAIREGRKIYDNIRKFIAFLLSCNIAEILIIFIATLLGWPLPLLILQILWINIVTDGFPALALGSDPASSNVMKRPPRNPEEKILSKHTMAFIIFISLIVTAVTLGMFNYFLPEGIEMARTMAFSTIIILELAVVYLVRSGYNIKPLSNKWLNLSILLSFGLLMIVLYTPLNSIFGVVPIDLIHIAVIVGVTVATYVIGFILTRVIKSLRLEV